jgi:hypothetical protein
LHVLFDQIDPRHTGGDAMRGIRLISTIVAAVLFAVRAVAAAELEPAPSIAGASTAISADVKFAILADWEVGDSYRIEYSAKRINRRNGVLNTGGAWAVITASVEEKTPDGYLVAWINEDVGLNNYAQGAGAKAKEIEAFLVDISKNLRTEIVTADTGFPTGLRNIDEMVSQMAALSDKILTTLETHPEMQAKLRSVMQQTLNPQFVEIGALRDAYLVYGLMGGTYRGGQVDTYDTELPFPFGGPPIPATLHVLLREFDEQAGMARIVSQSIPDAAQLKEAMVEWMTRIVTSQGQPAPDPSQVPELQMQDTTEYLYDFRMGLPREVKSEKFIRVVRSEDVRIDRRTYRISPLP